MKILSIVLISVGVMLFLTGSMFKIMHWPDLFRGIYSGPALAIAGVLLLIIQKYKIKSQLSL